MIVTCEFLFEGVIKQSENLPGVLLERDKVLVTDNESGIGLYNCILTDEADKVLIDLDLDGHDYLAGKSESLLHLLYA